mgnify:CR=1 FL=1
MTNEEKAKEIACLNYNEYTIFGGQEQISKCECEKSALEMAEWKDQQCPTKDVIRKVLDIAYDHQYTDRDGMHNLKFEADEVIEHWND